MHVNEVNMTSEIPVIDFSSFNIGENFDETKPEINKLAQEIHDAFTTIGFVYIKNHGIPESEVR
jgi:isopenicillin N synthase-like dioxygenase